MKQESLFAYNQHHQIKLNSLEFLDDNAWMTERCQYQEAVRDVLNEQAIEMTQYWLQVQNSSQQTPWWDVNHDHS